MSHEQVKGTFLAVGATAASTALLVGGIVGYNHVQQTAGTFPKCDSFYARVGNTRYEGNPCSDAD